MRLSLLVVSLLVAACSGGSTAPSNDGSLPLGTWGGENSGMIVSDTAMHLHVACTYGDVSGRIPLAANGQFDRAAETVERTLMLLGTAGDPGALAAARERLALYRSGKAYVVYAR